MRHWTWELLESTVDVIGEMRKYNEGNFTATESCLGFVLPPSYRELMSRFGAGIWEPELMIANPAFAKYPYSVLDPRTKRVRWIVEEYLKGGGKTPEFADQLRRLIGIGGWGNNYDLCWDRGRIIGKEMELCILTDRMEVIYCGRDLLEFLGTYWIDGKIDEVCPFENASWSGRPVFRVLS